MATGVRPGGGDRNQIKGEDRSQTRDGDRSQTRGWRQESDQGVATGVRLEVSEGF
jgi:hypothetical protein